MKTIPFSYGPYVERLGADIEQGVARLMAETRSMVHDYNHDVHVRRAMNDLFVAQNRKDDVEQALWGGFEEFASIALLLLKGVVIHIVDPDILARLKESRLPETMALDDIGLPFPILEMRFAHGPAVIVIDYGHPVYKDWYSKHIPVQLRAVEENNVLIGMGSHDPVKSDHFLAGKFIDRTKPILAQLNDVHKTYSTKLELKELEQQFTSAVFALLLGTEKVETPTRVHGLTPEAARCDKRRKHYKVVAPLFTMPHKGVEPANLVHDEPRAITPHWRKAHFRILLDKRFKRDENGRPRIVSVQASAIRGGSRVERKV
jgi:hypothetical protein